MTATRTNSISVLTVALMLLGGGCSSSSSDHEKDAGLVADGRIELSRDTDSEPTAADAPQADSIFSPDSVASDGTEGDALTAVDGPASDGAIPDAPAGDGLAATETAGGDIGTVCTGEYSGCGCGCCGGKPARTACYFPSRGETVATAEAHERAMTSVECSLAGCSAGTRYLCCPELPAETPSSTTVYAAEWRAMATGLDGLQISKKGSEGSDCATIHFFPPGENYTSIQLNLLNWGLSVISVGMCGDGGGGQLGIDGIGKITVTPNESRGDGNAIKCKELQVSIHATVFGVDENGSVKAVRMDADNLPVKPPASCLL